MPHPLVTQTTQAAVLAATSNIIAQALTAYREDRPLALSLRPILQFVAFAVLNTPPNVLWQEWLEATFPGSRARAHPPNPPTTTSTVASGDEKGKAEAVEDATATSTSTSTSASASRRLSHEEAGAIAAPYRKLHGLDRDAPRASGEKERRESRAAESVVEDGEKREMDGDGGGRKMEGKGEAVKPGKVQEGLDVTNTAIKFALDQTVGAVMNTLLFLVGMGAIKGMDGARIWQSVERDSIPLWLDGLKLWPLVSIVSFTMVPVEKRVVFGSVVGVAWGVYLSLLAA